MTHHRTILDLRDSGDLYHRPAQSRAPTRLGFDAAGRILGAPPGPWAEVMRLERLEQPGAVAVRIDGDAYLCAEDNGGWGRRPFRSDWETFHLLPREIADDLTRRTVPSFPRKPRTHQIARIIHQTSRGDTVPPRSRDNVERLRALNPGWAYRYWTDKEVHDFIYGCYGWAVLDAFLRIPPCYGAARADVFRYLCIYQFGGVYLDIKSAVVTPLDEILRHDDEYLLSQWSHDDTSRGGFGLHAELEGIIEGGEYQQWHVIGTAGHPFLEAVIDRVLRNIAEYDVTRDGTGQKGVLRVTGPIAYTLAIQEIRQRHAHRVVAADEVGLVYAATNRPEHAPHYSTMTMPVVL